MRLSTVPGVGVQDRLAIEALVSAAAAADGVAPLSEQAELHLRHAGDAAVRHVLARAADETLAGYASVDVSDRVEGAVAELVVHPASRRHGLGRALLREVEAGTPDERLRVWSHGDLPAGRALAAAAGYQRVRDLWLMRRPAGADLPAVAPPDGVLLRPFRPGHDEADWLGVNARAFAHHPEQGSWTAADLQDRMGEPWFDPEGFIVAQDVASGAMLGFHWTKVHDATAPGAGAVEPGAVGEVYVVGVDPAAQQRRLGTALTVAGLAHLAGRGVRSAMLYVESDNAPARRVYERLGFVHTGSDVMYHRP